MAKFLLLLMTLAFLALSSNVADCPIGNFITSNQTVVDFKNLFRSEQSNSQSSLNSSLNSIQDAAPERDKAALSSAELDLIIAPVLPESRVDFSVDLSLPAADLEHDEGYFQGRTAKSQLPNFFIDTNTATQPSRASIGGRLLMDEESPDYSMESILGIELSVHFKTN